MGVLQKDDMAIGVRSVSFAGADAAAQDVPIVAIRSGE
jgi:hypothetical protein